LIKNFRSSVNILVLIISDNSAYQKTVYSKSGWGQIWGGEEQP